MATFKLIELFNSLLTRKMALSPWLDDKSFDYNDEFIQANLLSYQLNNQDDRGSRKLPDVVRHADWIHDTLLSHQPAKIVDLGCGPGYYTTNLARKNHQCLGIDISKAAIQYANESIKNERLNCTFAQADMLKATLPENNDIIIMPYSIFNDLNALSVTTILNNVKNALRPNGYFYFEALRYNPPTQNYQARWLTNDKNGLFCPNSHLCLSEQFWHQTENVIIFRVYIIDLVKETITTYISSQQLYTKDEYQSLLEANGFTNISFPHHPPGTNQGDDAFYQSILAQRL